MTRPIKSLSIGGATSTGQGKVVQAQGHGNVLLFVIAPNLDTNNDTLTVELEHSLNDGEDWDTLETVTEADVEDETATEYLSNVAVDELRANLTELTDAAGDDLTVDVFVSVNGNPGTAYTPERMM